MPYKDPTIRREYQRTYMNRRYQENPEPYKKQAREWSRANRAKINKWKRPWTRKARAKARKEGKCAICLRKKRQKNFTSCRLCRIANRMRCSRWQRENRRRYRSHVNAYRNKNPQIYRHSDARKRAKRRKAKGSHTWAEWRTVCRKHKWRCAHCGKRKKLTRDHVIPLCKGGTDYISNIQPLCASCNSKKGGRREN